MKLSKRKITPYKIGEMRNRKGLRKYKKSSDCKFNKKYQVCIDFGDGKLQEIKDFGFTREFNPYMFTGGKI